MATKFRCTKYFYLTMSGIEVSTCDWCLQEAPVQTIDETLWRFWKVISAEDPVLTAYKNICETCHSRHVDFSAYIERCKTNAAVVDEVLCGGYVESEPPIDVEYHHVFDGGELSGSGPPGGSGGEQVPSSGGIEVKCPHCNKTFDGVDLLRAHSRRHSREQPFKCSLCGKSFGQSRTLEGHLRTHAGERLFGCSQCDRSFANSSALKRHARIHTGEKPFKCSLCGKAFAVSCYLKAHMRSHASDKPYGCSSCDKAFTWFKDLKKHRRRHTGSKC